MPKRRRLNIIRANRASSSQLQSQSEEQSMPLEPEPSQHEPVQESEDGQVEHSSDNAQRRKPRGPTRMPDIWDLEEGEHVVVKVNDDVAPIGDESCSLTRFIGSMVRMPSFAPINYTNWHDMSDDKKEEMWNTLETEEANGIPPSRSEMYIHSRTRKDGSVVNSKAAEIVELMKQGLSETNSQNSERSSWKDDVYSKVKGLEKRGRVRCIDTISTSSNKSGPSYSQSVQQHEDVQGLKAKVQGLKETLSTVLSVLQRQFPNDNVELLNTVSQMVNREVPDASSAPEFSPRGNIRSSESSHQPNQNEHDATP